MKRTWRKSVPANRPGRAGYTLIELIMVSSLAVVILSVSVSAYYAWTRPTSSETAVMELEAAFKNARSDALARQRNIRVSMIPNHRGTFVVVERQLGDEDNWTPIAPSNRLDWTSSSEETVFFRQDGSCCLAYGELPDPASGEEAFAIDLENIPGHESKSRGRLRTILLDPRSGLSRILERSYDDDGR